MRIAFHGWLGASDAEGAARILRSLNNYCQAKVIEIIGLMV